MGETDIVKERVCSELQRIEREHGIRVLLAVESGSRAWGFASPDSDYDVRFVYAHARDWYVSIVEPRDVIEQMLPGDLDVSGWDLRKTLRLFSKCNLALNEWLGSPIVYTECAGFRPALAQLLPQYFNAIAGVHHYRSIAARTFAENYADGRIRIKKLFYVLRPLLACRWIERNGSQPPTEFARLAAPAWVTSEERGWIDHLLRLKAAAAEAEPISLEERWVERIRSELEHYEAIGSSVLPAPKAGTGELDALLRAWVVAIQ
jgi:predicted nucleotidyltransferase